MPISNLERLKKARQDLAQLEAAVAKDITKELAGLPSKFGFPNIKSFVAAVRASGKSHGLKPTLTAGKKKRRRAVITDAIRAKVKALIETGKTGSQVAKALKISLPSVQNIKKSLGLVKKR